MRLILALTALAAAVPASAQSVAIDRAVYVEREADGVRQVEPASTFTRGDRVVTILRWSAPARGFYTVTSPVPAGLAVESASHPDVEISLDGGRTWRALADPDRVPAATTHLRWQASGDGRLSYRAVVR